MRTLLLLLLTTAVARADQTKPPIAYPIPCTFASPNGQYVLVLIPPPSTDPRIKETADQTALRAKYRQSGLYSATDATAPRWSVDWYDYEAFVADDGVHVVRIHGENALWRHYPSGQRLDESLVAEQLAAPGMSLYASGELLRTYSVRELVTKPEDLPQTMKYILWNAGGTMTQDGKQFVLMTQDARQIFFELETGRIAVNREAGLGNARVWVMRVSLFVLGGTIVAMLAMYLYLSRPRRA